MRDLLTIMLLLVASHASAIPANDATQGPIPQAKEGAVVLDESRRAGEERMVLARGRLTSTFNGAAARGSSGKSGSGTGKGNSGAPGSNGPSFPKPPAPKYGN